MHSNTCNKCRIGRPSPGDSWRVGCSALEVSLQDFRKRWALPGTGAVAEEAAVSAARLGSEEEEEEHFVPTPDQIREALRSQPKPSTPVDYNLEEADFWRYWHVPPGSVIEFVDPDRYEEDLPKAAVLVLEVDPRPHGIWLVVKSLAATKEEKKKVDSYFRGSKKRVHQCYLMDGSWSVEEQDELHFTKFRWYPPGDFSAEWLPRSKLPKAGTWN